MCEAGCLALALIQQGVCIASLSSCSSTAGNIRDLCGDLCFEGTPGPCGAAVAQTSTAMIPLSADSVSGGRLAGNAIDFHLARAEKRGDETVVLDEWVTVQDGRVLESSNPAFAGALIAQDAAPAPGTFLVVQEPIHVMNRRHVWKPEVRILSTGLAPSERGSGQIIAARLELSAEEVVDRVQILYTSEPLDESELERLVSHRLGLVFSSEKRHRTAVYVVFRLSDRFEVLSTHAALPQCCCGGSFCP